MEIKELETAAEGVLFAAGEPVHIDRICLALGTDRPRAEEALQRLSGAGPYTYVPPKADQPEPKPKAPEKKKGGLFGFFKK